MPWIKLSKPGKEVYVDEEDFEYLSQWKWSYSAPNASIYKGKPRHEYAIRSAWDKNRKKGIYTPMHKIVLERKLGRPLEPNELADHRDGNGLDNSRGNLRVATEAGNMRNRRPEFRRKGLANSSKYKGVSWDKGRNKWAVKIRYLNKNRTPGRFVNELDAAKCYDEFAVRYFGEFALTNAMLFPEDFQGGNR